jgi:hypothetical protein
MFIKIEATGNFWKYDSDGREVIERTYMWVLNVDHITAIVPGCIYLSHNIRRKTKEPPHSDERPPSNIISLWEFHTVKTEIVQFKDMLKLPTLNR